ncbi:MAG: transposase [Sedimenticola sp.]
MREYSEELKANIIAKMLPPNNVGVPQLVRETGISKNTPYTWRIKHRKSQGDTPAQKVACGELSSETKYRTPII